MRQPTFYVQVRLSKEEKAKLSKLAAEQGMSVSQYVRWKLLYQEAAREREA